MNILSILLAQSRGAATIEIIVMLLGATIIGYLTAWQYYKGIYEKQIKAVEDEKHELYNRIVKLDGQLVDHKKKISDKEAEIEHLYLELKTLDVLYKKAVYERDDMTLKNSRTSQLLTERNEELVQISQRKHLLDFNSFGTATEAEKDDLKMISGIGPFIEERLNAVDIFTFSQISKLTHTDIETITEVIELIPGRIEEDNWVGQARKLAKV